MPEEFLISVAHVSKAYRIWEAPIARLVAPLQASLAGFFPKESKAAQALRAHAASHYKDFYALRDVSFTVKRGESVGIIGRNGSGKSTLLQIIAGTLQPTTGSVRVNGRIAALLELGSGFNPEFTGRENVFLSGAIYGFSKDEMGKRFEAIAAFAEIGDYIEQPVKTYSSGMQVRLAFAVATSFKPDVLIVDEALSVGDAYFQAKCHERIARYKKEGMSLLLVTHGTEDLVRQCDRALFLRVGLLEKDGAPREVTNLYLDDLFGKQREQGGSASKPIDLSIMASDQDVFHTRPGYRKEEHRWGQGGAKILDYYVTADGASFPQQLDSQVTAGFYFKVHFEQSFNNIVPGFLIKTLEGIILYGTNSFLATNGKENHSANAGAVMLFKFSVPLDLNIGNYLISFGISSGNPEGLLTPLDRRYDSLLITVTRQVPFWGIVDMEAAFELVARQ